jgi:ABC-type multidrug transport system fused ATPase/permease subunit
VRDCDVIYLLEHGVIEAVGSYQELLAQSGQFRAMARTG